MSATISISQKNQAISERRERDSDYLKQLRKLAGKNPDQARDQAWDWFREFTDLREHDRLAALFDQGTAPDAPDGDCEGMVLGLQGNLWLAGVDRLVRIGQKLGGIGWTGKSFDAQRGTGYNRLTSSSRIPMFMAMPNYPFDRIRSEIIGFRFDHRREPSPLSPRQEVLAICYDRPAYENPLMMPNTRDELVELLPNTYLGRALLMQNGRWQLAGYFALRYPVQTEKNHEH